MIEYENDPVWTPLNPADGVPWWNIPEHREPLRIARDRSFSGGEGWSVARWDEPTQEWVKAPPAPVEVTGVPSRWVIRDRAGYTRFSVGDAKQAWDKADRYAICEPYSAPFSVEACIPVSRNEEAS